MSVFLGSEREAQLVEEETGSNAMRCIDELARLLVCAVPSSRGLDVASRGDASRANCSRAFLIFQKKGIIRSTETDICFHEAGEIYRDRERESARTISKSCRNESGARVTLGRCEL